MPFLRPTLTALRNQAVEDIVTSGVPNLDGLLRNAVLRVLAWVIAGLAYSVYGYADWIARMGVPFTAADEFLEAWAALVGVYRKDATTATGNAQFNGTPGAVLPIGSMLARPDATPYETTADGTVDSGGVLVVPFVALVPGIGTNADAGSPIALATPVQGINGSGVVTGAATGGADQETDAELRSRMLLRYREPPQGGSTVDYIEWALQVPGVTRAWAIPNGMGPGTVIVYPMLDDANSEFGGFPQGTNGVSQYEKRIAPLAAGDQLIIADHIFPLQPVTALVYVVSPRPYPIDVVLYSLDPNTQAIRDQITAALDDLFALNSEVGVTIYPSQLYDAILAVPGINHFVIGQPNAAVYVTMGHLPVTGNLIVQS